MNKREDIKRNKYNKYENRACFKSKCALILPFIIMIQPKHENFNYNFGLKRQKNKTSYKLYKINYGKLVFG